MGGFVWYAVFIIILEGEVHVFKDINPETLQPYAYHSQQECINESVKKLTPLWRFQQEKNPPETFADAVCLLRDFTKIGDM